MGLNFICKKNNSFESPVLLKKIPKKLRYVITHFTPFWETRTSENNARPVSITLKNNQLYASFHFTANTFSDWLLCSQQIQHY